MYFTDRKEAGQALAQVLSKYRGKDVVVYALPRGGVVTAVEVARYLHAPLDLIIARKIGHPHQPEYAIGAVAEDGHIVFNQRERERVDKEYLESEISKQKAEAKRRREVYLHDTSRIPVKDKIAILVDDGVATGLTVRVGIKELKHRDPAKVVVAVPFVVQRTAKILRTEADELIALDIPSDEEFLGAVGAYYDDFRPVENGAVISMMSSYAKEYADSNEQLAAVGVDPLLFTFPQYQRIAIGIEKLPWISTGVFITKRFSNGELQIDLPNFRSEIDCYVLGSISPPDEQLFSFVLLCHTLKKDLARKVVAVLPYLAYTRQDKNQRQKSFTTALIGELFKAAGIDEVLTVDVHSPEAKRLFPMHLTSLSPAKIFADELSRIGMDHATIVAPDHGAIDRATHVAKYLGHEREIAYLTKERIQSGIIHHALHGEVGKEAVIIDDMLDTGATLISCAEVLREHGAESIVIMVTHGLFSDNTWTMLWEKNVDYIYCTDSIPLPSYIQGDHIRVLSIAPLLREKLQEMRHESFAAKVSEEVESYEYA